MGWNVIKPKTKGIQALPKEWHIIVNTARRLRDKPEKFNAWNANSELVPNLAILIVMAGKIGDMRKEIQELKRKK